MIRKYYEFDVCFVGVTGHKESGKSFFCDKIYNLAETKGNNVRSFLRSIARTANLDCISGRLLLSKITCVYFSYKFRAVK